MAASTTNISSNTPFDINQPNKETVAAMLEAERIAKDPSVKGYTDLDKLFADLKK
jgi:DNA-damage-inducible protein J